MGFFQTAILQIRSHYLPSKVVINAEKAIAIPFRFSLTALKTGNIIF